ncbi:MAG: alpha-hydroxy acid oxidase [Pseudomonadota bacterium]
MNAPRLQPLPGNLVNLADHEAHARGRLDDNAWAYFNGAAADGLALRANRTAWDDIALLPRVLRTMTGGHTGVELLGQTLPHPVMVAPMAYQRMAHPDGEIATALAAAAQGSGLVVSTQASALLEDIARAFVAGPATSPLWFQLYLQPDREVTLSLVARAQAAGFNALVLTVDAPVSGVRDGERRASFRLPPDITAVNLPSGRAARDGKGSSGGLAGGLAERAATWADVEWLISNCRLPVILKGLLHPLDAKLALSLGVSAVIVSNHGGRTLDTSIATATALPRIADAVGDSLPLLVDGGIRRGTDVLKAIALGARAVLVGRPIIWGLANAGAAGVAHVLRLLIDELEIAMVLCGEPHLLRLRTDLIDRIPHPSSRSN